MMFREKFAVFASTIVIERQFRKRRMDSQIIEATDIWSSWLLRGRHAGDAERQKDIAVAINRFRDRVLDGAALAPGLVLVDVGSGDGLIAFGAIERMQKLIHVVLTDISTSLLAHTERLATSKGIDDCCTFVQSSAEYLEGIEDEMADRITTRAVLAYVKDKPSAASNFFRVLKSGGRISIAEPINQDDALDLANLAASLASGPRDPKTEWARLVQRCRARQLPSSIEEIKVNPITNFNERDLVRLFQGAGFVDIHMELHIDISTTEAMPWDIFVDTAPRPGTPTLREVFSSELTHDEQAMIEASLRPNVEAGTYTSRSVSAYLTARKPDRRH